MSERRFTIHAIAIDKSDVLQETRMGDDGYPSDGVPTEGTLEMLEVTEHGLNGVDIGSFSFSGKNNEAREIFERVRTLVQANKARLAKLEYLDGQDYLRALSTSREGPE